jgi:hypothetical protein
MQGALRPADIPNAVFISEDEFPDDEQPKPRPRNHYALLALMLLIAAILFAASFWRPVPVQ